MSKIRFLTNYRGVLTSEKYYRAGEVAELAKASALVADGRAEYVTPDKDYIDRPAQPEPVKADDLDGLSLTKLRGMVKAKGIKGYSRMKRDEAISKLRGG